VSVVSPWWLSGFCCIRSGASMLQRARHAVIVVDAAASEETKSLRRLRYRAYIAQHIEVMKTGHGCIFHKVFLLLGQLGIWPASHI
jgi:hypothetical protein